ncbi:hypothetical protein HNQ77_002479 [Silvibacterium bohemicum]|uniref:Uncharacterized protein n=1 Tax=Silvibacterium bohemicum TaxID=1577686 RepID=A0A841JVN5_9BACT|nr:hypothetical protein [Silvibacterium bohemicum]MBB6144527.1 hypothetical protein [Silvibacterium bohemicum]
MQFGTNITSAAPGSAQGSYLIVSDIVAAQAERELRRMHANYDQTLVLVSISPGAHVGELASPAGR